MSKCKRGMGERELEDETDRAESPPSEAFVCLSHEDRIRLADTFLPRDFLERPNDEL